MRGGNGAEEPQEFFSWKIINGICRGEGRGTIGNFDRQAVRALRTEYVDALNAIRNLLGNYPGDSPAPESIWAECVADAQKVLDYGLELDSDFESRKK